jgi:hypothetical protein
LDLVRPEQLTRSLPPQWESVQAEWDEALGFFLGAGLSKDEAHGLAMATQELLENAVKYGQFTDGQKVTLNLSASRGAVTIEVVHPATTDEKRLKSLDETIQWIRGFQNPFEAYVERLKQLAAQLYDPTVSGLGLVRIAYEAQCLLDFYIDEANQLALSAVYRPIEQERA